jgi:prefoldin subunit 5
MIGFPFDSRVTYDNIGEPVYDRAISSKPLKSLIGALFSTGILPNPSDNLRVSTQETDFTVDIASGFAMIQGGMKLETEVTSLEVEASDENSNRIDSVVLRWDENDDVRECYFYVKKGTASSEPVRPSLTREGSIYEIGLADILVVANSTILQNANITDTRYDSDRCGVISSISEFDTTFIYNQVTSDLADFRSNAESEFASWSTQERADYEAWIMQQENAFGIWMGNEQLSFEEWVQTIHDILDEEAAGHLQNEIDELNTTVGGFDSRIEAVEESVQGYDEQIEALDTRITSAEEDITDLTGDLSAVSTTVSGHTTSITDLEDAEEWADLTISASGWSSSTVTINSQSYYRYQVAVTSMLDTGVVNVMIAPSSTSYDLPSQADEENFNKLDYTLLDTANNILYFYAKEKPSATFKVRCQGVTFT